MSAVSNAEYSFLNFLLMHGTPATESIVLSSVEVSFALAVTLTRTEEQGAIGVYIWIPG